MFQTFSISYADVDAFEDKTKTHRSARLRRMNKHSLINSDFN